ncbi:AraC family transcriptional regulator [Oceanimonas sp. CHS3-5]|uniref:AraC family transcriptional regulator n=1 Tax=Oceanimonas sp. CHS3-5 TaxID=3068186 RepID=UPI0027402B35|nr:AraC family transcriptional regulator [Oceanimonas sp. CHS3-5]MDP5292964.1 AraC family transcriptional regulator [Oceanimonas sp. CHS3-5]
MSSVKYWKSGTLSGLELCLAEHAGFSYGRHIHLDYHLGLVEAGAQKFMHKGSSAPLASGQLSLLNPDVAHDGGSFDERGFRVRVFSIAPELVAGLADELEQPQPFFAQPLIHQPRLYHRALTLHRQLEQANTDPHFAESRLLALLADCLPLQSARPLAPPLLARVRERLLDDLDQPHSLAELASELGLSRFQFLRQFKAGLDMTPHAYLKRLRLEAAKKRLAAGEPVLDTALATGFFDQAHFHHAFVAAYRLTPARFRAQMQ